MLKPRRNIAVHPGEILQEVLEQNQLSQSQLALQLGMTPAKINEICRKKRGISPDMAMRLSKALATSPLFWLNLQKNWELSQLQEADYQHIQPLRLIVGTI